MGLTCGLIRTFDVRGVLVVGPWWLLHVPPDNMDGSSVGSLVPTSLLASNRLIRQDVDGPFYISSTQAS